MQPRYFNENDLNSPKKPKILISMHPIDRCVCFEKLCDGILERTDCAICTTIRRRTANERISTAWTA